MTAVSAMSGGDAWHDGYLSLDSVGSAMMVCDRHQVLQGASPAALQLFARAGVTLAPTPTPLPDGMFIALRNAIAEQALWRPAPGSLLIGVSRYALGTTHSLLLMREVPEGSRVHPGAPPPDAQLARRLHEQRLEVTGRLVVTLAHDLRNPLASILLNVEALRALDLEADAREAVDDVRGAVERVARTIDALVEFGRLGPPSVSDVPLEDVLARVAGALRPALREGRHQLHVDLKSLAVSANPLLLEQILANLVTNAIESVGQGVSVVVAAETDGRLVRVTVTDDGPGIPAEMRERVFEPFLTNRLGRIGLGLTIAREAAQSMGGRIVALEAPGGGARLQLTLAAARTAR